MGNIVKTKQNHTTTYNMNDKKEQYLKDVYFNASNYASYGGINELIKYVRKDGKYKFTRQEIKDWLHKQYIYTSFATRKRTEKFNGIVAPYGQYQVDAGVGKWRRPGDG